MDGNTQSISSSDLYARLGTASAPVLLDVRREPAFAEDGVLIVSALRRSPGDVERWSRDLIAGRPLVAYCVHGHEVSQGVAASLRQAGIDAIYLEGGIAGWKERALPTRKNLGAIEAKWVTREHPKIDRIACPHRVSMADQPLHQSAGGVPLRPGRPGGRGRQTGRGDAL
jgi:rhodanese-related sulfurtransferase